jgi:hypothetical protein
MWSATHPCRSTTETEPHIPNLKVLFDKIILLEIFGDVSDERQGENSDLKKKNKFLNI